MKNFKLNLIVRLSLIFISFFVLLFLIFSMSTIVTPIVVALLIILQIHLLIRYVDLTNNLLAHFFQSIEFSDFSQSFSKQKFGKSFNSLTTELSKIQNSMKKTRWEKEEQFQFFQTIIQNASVGIIVFDKYGEVRLVNNSAKKLLRVQSLNNIKNIKNKFSTSNINLTDLKTGDKKTVEFSNENEIIQLAVQAAEFKSRNSNYTLLSIQNIQKELNDKEVESWQKLIKVLTHEIMNSITPISSLSSTINNLIANEDQDKSISLENLNDIKNGIAAIKRRSEGLLHFVDKYRSLTKIHKPNLHTFSVKSLFERIEKLFNEEFINNSINFKYQVIPTSLKLTADSELVEQALLNLFYNSISALKDTNEKFISIKAYKTIKGKIEIAVKDNGQGISTDIKEQIFIPFYTTKKDGSGIGLSLAKQIINLHGGEISVSSNKNEGTIFFLLF